ncbi:MAG: thiol protease/hemagglutinin PrtT [Dysgonamonadaceae bacterium]|jgi:hypothetical protein|nr:thiol protease/hemagglutinin PrtT [Dysgonamonadaceae bacterium]
MNRVILANIVFLLLFGNSFAAFSNPVDIETAKTVARNFMSVRRHTSNTVSGVVVEKWEGKNSFYVVNFREGGWVMVSADDSTVPVLAYSLDGTYRIDDEKPDGFLYLVDKYKEQVDSSRQVRASGNNEILEKWDKLITAKNSISLKVYTTGTRLLNIPGRGEVAWRQGSNNANGCNPAYNSYAPSTNGTTLQPGKCDCGRMPVGCGAVAMGQVMWYWQWPNRSPDGSRPYNWDLMPASLSDGQTAQGDAIARLLKDCGDATGMNYLCTGSFTFVEKIEYAMRNYFNFKAARLVYRAGYNNTVWNNLIRAEIDCERPVIYYGEKSQIGVEKHYFVIDGYDAVNHNLFHINFGWGGYTAWHLLDGISGVTTGGTNYNFNTGHSAIIGISPTYSLPGNANITDVSYSTVTGSKTEEAKQSISLPVTGKNLTVESGGNLTLVAGNSITLRSGFHAKAGSHLTARIEPSYAMNMDISVPSGWPGGFTLYNGLWLRVNNANSYDLKLSDRYGTYHSAGTITNNSVCIFNEGYWFTGTYTCTIRLRNNYGRILEKTWYVQVYEPIQKSAMSNDSINIDCQETSLPVGNVADIPLITETDILVYPNPNSGIVHVNVRGYDPAYNIRVYNVAGTLIYQSTKITEPLHTFDMSRSPDGTYMVQLEIDGRVITKKLILSK